MNRKIKIPKKRYINIININPDWGKIYFPFNPITAVKTDRIPGYFATVASGCSCNLFDPGYDIVAGEDRLRKDYEHSTLPVLKRYRTSLQNSMGKLFGEDITRTIFNYEHYYYSLNDFPESDWEILPGEKKKDLELFFNEERS